MINEDEAVRLKKEKEKVDYDRRQRLNEILLIHPKNRTKAIESELSELLVQFPCFHSVAEDNFDRLIQLSREIYMECLLQDTVIIKQDEEPDNCYLITQGQCKVYVTFKTMRFDKLKLTTKHMCDIGNKTMFGELSLLFNGKRTATVKTMEASYVIIIPKATFVKYMKEPMLKNLSITIKFLKSLSFFDELDPNVLLILASKTILNILQKDTLITKQNKKSKYIYFISTGRVKVVRMIPILKPKREYLEDQAKLPLLYKDPTEEQLKNPDIVHTKLIEIAELGHYECFGEDYNKASNFLLSPQVLRNQPMPYGVISCLPLECYCIQKRDFYEYLDDKVRKKFMIYLRQYPRDYELRAHFYQQLWWMIYKENYLKQNTGIPIIIANDSEMMKKKKILEYERDKKLKKVILPKINKKEQVTQRIMAYQKFSKSSTNETKTLDSEYKSSEQKKNTQKQTNENVQITAIQEFTNMANGYAKIRQEALEHAIQVEKRRNTKLIDTSAVSTTSKEKMSSINVKDLDIEEKPDIPKRASTIIELFDASKKDRLSIMQRNLTLPNKDLNQNSKESSPSTVKAGDKDAESYNILEPNSSVRLKDINESSQSILQNLPKPVYLKGKHCHEKQKLFTINDDILDQKLKKNLSMSKQVKLKLKELNAIEAEELDFVKEMSLSKRPEIMNPTYVKIFNDAKLLSKRQSAFSLPKIKDEEDSFRALKKLQTQNVNQIRSLSSIRPPQAKYKMSVRNLSLSKQMFAKYDYEVGNYGSQVSLRLPQLSEKDVLKKRSSLLKVK